MSDAIDTIAAIATPPGRGGIGIVRISGPQCLNIAKTLGGIVPRPRFAHYAAFRDSNDLTIDKGVLLYFQKPESFTGEDVLELHGHGGQIVLNMILSRVIELGARYARPGEFTERAFLNGKLDLLQAEAVADLIDSMSEKAARSAARSLAGEFSYRINTLVDALVKIRTMIEGTLDFPDEDIDFISDMDIPKQIDNWCLGLEEIITMAGKGRVLNEGIKAVILGPPNVGKSSLLNKLAQIDKAIVTPVPGTTRDVIEENIQIDGILINLSDTAGLRDTTDPVEQEGVHRALRASETADVVLLMHEYDNENKYLLLNSVEHKYSGKNTIIVINKIDLSNKEPGRCVNESGTPIIYLSAKTGAGIQTLINELKSQAGLENDSEDLLLANNRQILALKRTAQHVKNGQLKYQKNKAVELLAADLYKAQKVLGEITGEVSADELLGEIFSRFCIGK